LFFVPLTGIITSCSLFLYLYVLDENTFGASILWPAILMGATIVSEFFLAMYYILFGIRNRLEDINETLQENL